MEDKKLNIKISNTLFKRLDDFCRYPNCFGYPKRYKYKQVIGWALDDFLTKKEAERY